ncbi:MAG: DUF2339 domain-containing protein [Caldilineaceae bacterium]|nr:DUF2339 domain-containing protein [Caldilineaceae bacterium]
MEAAIGFLICLGILAVAGAIGIVFAILRRDISHLKERILQLELLAGLAEMPTAGAMPPAAPVVDEPHSSVARAPIRTPAPTAAMEPPKTLPGGPRPLSLPSPAPALSAAAPAPQPAGPRWYEANPVLDWFLRRHILVQLGLVVLFIGVALLLKYAVDQGWVSLEVRHLAAAAGGIALGITGWFVRTRRRSYGLALEGGGLAILYLTTFSAYRLYALLPAPLAFGIFAVLAVACAALAVLQNAPILAYLASAGAFAAPLLVAEEGGSYAALLGYYTIVNAGVAAIIYWRGWQPLALLSALFTYVVGMGISLESYTPDDYAGMQAFAALFFVFYAGLALQLATQRAKPSRVDIPTSVSVLNVLAALGWQTIITANIDKGLGYSTVAGGLFYLAVAGLLFWRPWKQLALHRELALFFGLFLLSLAVPVFYEARITGAIWAVGGGLWMWAGFRRNRTWMMGWGLVTQFAAGALYLPPLFETMLSAFEPESGRLLFLNTFFLGCALLGLAGMATAIIAARHDQRTRGDGVAAWQGIASVSFIWGVLWWIGGGLVDATLAPEHFVVSTAVVFVAASAVAMDFIGEWLAYRSLRSILWGLLPLLMPLALLQTWEIDYALQGGAWYAWPLALAAHGWMLWRHGDEPRTQLYHAGGAWLLAYLAATALHGLANHWGASPSVATALSMVILAAMIAALIWLAPRLPRLVAAQAQTYLTWGAGPIAGVALVYLIFANTWHDGSWALAYIPIFNPLSAGSALLLAIAFVWLVWTRNAVTPAARAQMWWLRWPWLAIAIYALSAALARVAHHHFGVPFTAAGLMDSALYQTMLSVAWSILALGLMFGSRGRKARSLWFAGAVVLGMTVLKLFLVDLAGAGTVARIVSFIGVGLLILVIAFVAPVPPRKEAPDQPDLRAADL